MARTTAPQTTDAPAITSDIVRAFAEALDHGFTGSLNDFAASEEGQLAATAAKDQRDAELRGLRMGYARAVAKDFKVNGKLTEYSKDRAIQLRDYLNTVDFDAITADEAADDATDEDGDATE